MFYISYRVTKPLPPGDNPIAVNKYYYKFRELIFTVLAKLRKKDFRRKCILATVFSCHYVYHCLSIQLNVLKKLKDLNTIKVFVKKVDKRTEIREKWVK
jgi:hypothetical protein